MVFVAHKYMPDQIPADEMKATFAARHHTLRYLVKSLRDQAHARTLTSYLITGPRGSGKTTLIRMLCLKLEEDPELTQAWLPVRFPEELPTVTSLRDLICKALEILADADVPAPRDWYLRAEEESDEREGQDIALAGLQQIARDQDRRLVLFVENLDLVFERGLTDKTQATLRRLLMAEPFMMIIGSAVRPFPELQSYHAAFFNYFCPVELEPLDEKQAYDVLKRRAAWDGNKDFERQYRLHSAKIRSILMLTGGNPRLLLMLYEILARQDIQSAVHALRRLVDELTPLLKDILEHQLTKQQVKVIDALMQLDGNATPSQLAGKSRLSLNIVTSQLKRLEEARIVAVAGGGKGRAAWYSIRDRLFYAWYQMRYLQPGRRRIELFVQVLQIWFEADERMEWLHRFSNSAQSCDQSQKTALAETAEYFAASLARTQHQEHAWQMAIKMYVQAGQTDLAVQLLKEFTTEIANSQEIAVSHVSPTLWLCEHGSVQEALELAHARIKKNPEDMSLLREYGLILWLSDNYPEAVACFDRLSHRAQANPIDKATALLIHGLDKWRQADTDEALADFTAALEVLETPPELTALALFVRGGIRSLRRDADGTIADYTAALKVKETPSVLIAWILHLRGLTRRMEGDIDGAVADFTAVIKLDGASSDQVAKALFNRGDAKCLQGDTEGAYADYSTVVDLPNASHEELARALLLRGMIRRARGDEQGAMADLLAAVGTAGGLPRDRVLAAAVIITYTPLAKNGDTARKTAGILREWLEGLADGERTQHTLGFFVTLAEFKAQDAWLFAFRELTKDQPEETARQLEFLRPVATVLETGDMSTLDAIPPEQRDFALHILQKLGQQKPKELEQDSMAVN